MRENKNFNESFEEWEKRVKEEERTGEENPYEASAVKMGKNEINGEKEDEKKEEEWETEREKPSDEENNEDESTDEDINEEDEDNEGDIGKNEIESVSLEMFGERRRILDAAGDEDGSEEDFENKNEEWGEYGEGNNMGQQVETSLFGNIERNDAEEGKEGDGEGGEEKGKNKISFTELRNGRPIPRLKKNMVMGICIGVVLGFLILVNLLAVKKNKKSDDFEGTGNKIENAGKIDLSELSKKSDREALNRAEREAERKRGDSYSSEYNFEGLPEYENKNTPWRRQETQPVVVDPNVENERIQREQQAMSAPLSKEGGYGRNQNYGNNTVSQNGNTQQGGSSGIPGMPQMTKDEYVASQLSSLAKITGGVQGQEKQGARYTEAGAYNANNKEAGNYEYFEDNVIFPGTIIHAVLVSRIDTDYPGPIHARTVENVYDSKTGKNLLIPQGTVLQGDYSSSSIGVAKVQVAWESMVVNYNGVAYQVSLGGMAGVDKRGRSGIAGTLDDHYFEWLKAAGIVSMFTMMNSEITYQTRNQKNKQVLELIDVNQGIVNQLADRIMTRALDIQPTVRVANGKAVSVSVNKAVILRPFEAVKAEQKYIRKGY